MDLDLDRTTNYTIRFNEDIRCWYQRKASMKPRVLALKATAHKLA